MLNKKDVRTQLLARRKAFTQKQVLRSSELVAKNILDSAAYKKAQVILGYLAFGRELSIDIVLEQALSHGKLLAIPHIVSQTDFEAVRLSSMEGFVLDRYGIRSVAEPVEVIDPKHIDLILVPGVAFARNGARLGMGAGYYDRFLLRAAQAEIMGVAYEELLTEGLPMDEYDIYMQKIVTEQGVISCCK